MKKNKLFLICILLFLFSVQTALAASYLKDIKEKDYDSVETISSITLKTENNNVLTISEMQMTKVYYEKQDFPEYKITFMRLFGLKVTREEKELDGVRLSNITYSFMGRSKTISYIDGKRYTKSPSFFKIIYNGEEYVANKYYCMDIDESGLCKGSKIKHIFEKGTIILNYDLNTNEIDRNSIGFFNNVKFIEVISEE